MKQQRFGPTNTNVSIIGQGTWMTEESGRARSIQALQAGIDLGMTHIDTAEMYTGAEEIVAEAIEGRRDEILLVSKVHPRNASRQGTLRACEQSLKRLRTDRIDCYLLHWRSEFPLADTIAAFGQLKSDGKILSWGVSNFDVPDLDDALAIAGPGQIACNQVLYHLKERAIEHAVIPWCEANDVAVVAYSPFGQGDFPGPDTDGGRVLAEIAARHGATPHQVGLAFLTRRPSLFAIPKASDPKHATGNAGAGSLSLAADDIGRIERTFPRGSRPEVLPTL